MRHGRRRQRRQEPPAVAHAPQPRVEDGEDAAVLAMADQPAEALLQREDRERHLILAEGGSPPRALIASIRAAVIGSPGDANGSLSMITQLSASPTTSTPCQKLEVASSTAFGVRLEVAQQRRARRRALHEHRIVELGSTRCACTSRRFA